jgi:hypothetical protein
VPGQPVHLHQTGTTTSRDKLMYKCMSCNMTRAGSVPQCTRSLHVGVQGSFDGLSCAPAPLYIVSCHLQLQAHLSGMLPAPRTHRTIHLCTHHPLILEAARTRAEAGTSPRRKVAAAVEVAAPSTPADRKAAAAADRGQRWPVGVAAGWQSSSSAACWVA